MDKENTAGNGVGVLQRTRVLPGRRINLQTFSSLKNPRYRWLWLGTISSFMSMGMNQVALGWLVYKLTESPLALGIAGSSFGIPMLLLSLLGGAVADRVPRRNLLMVTQTTVALSTLIIALLVNAGLVQFWHLVVVGMFNGVVVAFNIPARQAFVADVAGGEGLINAIALNAAGMNLTSILGPSLAGMIIAVFGIGSVFYLMVGFYLFAAFSIAMIPPMPALNRKHGATIPMDIAEGLGYVRRTPVLVGLITIAFVPLFFGMPFQTLLPAFVVGDLGRDAQSLGLLMSASGIGAVLGSLTVASFGDLKHRGLIMIVGVVAWGLALVVMTASRDFSIGMLCLFWGWEARSIWR